MFRDKMKVKEQVTASMNGPAVQPEDVVLAIIHSPIHHGNGCNGVMDFYHDVNSGEIRAKCDVCGARYMVAREVAGIFTRFRE